MKEEFLDYIEARAFVGVRNILIRYTSLNVFRIINVAEST